MASQEYLAKYLSSGKKKKSKSKSKVEATQIIDETEFEQVAWDRKEPDVVLVMRKPEPQALYSFPSAPRIPSSDSPNKSGSISPTRSVQHDASPDVEISPRQRRRRHDSSDEEDSHGHERRARHDTDSEGEGGPRHADYETSDAEPSDTVYRDALGRKVKLHELRQSKEDEAKQALEKQRQKYEWGQGAVQREPSADQIREASKPLARSIEDKDLNEHLKARQRWGDPGAMLGVKPKTSSSDSEFPRYEGGWPSNRFMIPPGYRWDGVDRSNGFERKVLLAENQRSAFNEAAYKWSTQDM